MKSFLPFFLALILGTALFKFCHNKSSAVESAEPELDWDNTTFRRPERELPVAEEALEEGLDILHRIQPESTLSKRQRRLFRNDRRRAGSKGGSKGSSKGGSKGSSKGKSKGCPDGFTYTKGSKGSKGVSSVKGACVANAPPPVLQPVYIAPLAPVAAPEAAPVTVPFTVPITAPASPPLASPVAITISGPSSKGSSPTSKGGSSKGGSPTVTTPVASPSGTSAPASVSSSSAPVATFGTPTASGTSAPATTSGTGSIYVEATAEDCQAITSGGLVQGQNGLNSQTFTFSFDLALNNGVTNMATVIATAKAALAALVAQGIVNCGFSSSKGSKGSRRKLQRRRRVQHNRRHHHRHHQRHQKQRRRLQIDPNVIANVEFDVSQCVETSPGLLTCDATVEVFLKGPTEIEDIEAVLNGYLGSPTFNADSGMEEISSAFSATDVEHVSPTPESDAGGRGDPHFTSWKGEHFEFHGQCDLVLAKDATFAGGLGLDVQIRTKLVRFWSYIKTAAVRIGDDIIEVEGSTDIDNDAANYWFNFEHQGKSKTMGGFPLAIFDDGARPFPKRRWEIDFNSKFPGQKIVISTYKEFVKVDFANPSAAAVGNAVGILGDFHSGETLARDQSTVIGDFNELGLEWQVRPADDMMLFHDISYPQFPKPCVLPEDPRGEMRRRMDESSISMEDAEKACATLNDPLSIKDCVYDILATQDLDMVGAY